MTNTFTFWSDPGRSRRTMLMLTALLLSVIAFGLVMYITPFGAAVSPDSVNYISAARNLIQGRGLVHLAANGELVPLTLWAPLYPIMLSAGDLIGLDPWEFGRYLNAFLFATNILLLQVIIFKMTGGSLGAALIGGGLMILSPIVLEVHTWIWTEPLAILLGFGSLLIAQIYISRGSVAFLVLVGILLALGLLNRYAAVAFPLTVIAALLFNRDRKSKLTWWQELLILGAISFVPLGIVMLRNAFIEVGAVGRNFIFNPASVSDAVHDGINAISAWTVPGRIQGTARYTLTIVISLLWFGLISWGIVRERRTERKMAQRRVDLHQILYIFLWASIIPPIAVNMFFSPGVHVDERVLSLAYIAGVLLSVFFFKSIVVNIFRIIKGEVEVLPVMRVLFSVGILALGIAIIALNVVHALDWIRNAQDDGRGFAQRSWQDSKVIEYLNGHAGEATLISNVPDAIILLTGQTSIMMPGSTQEILELITKYESNPKDEQAESFWIVFFRTRLYRTKVPSEVMLANQLDLKPIYGSETGSIYSLTTRNE